MAANVLADALNDGLRSRVTVSSDRTRLLDEEEQTAFTDDEDRGEDPSLPFGGKVYLARRKKPDTWLTFFLEILAVCLVFCFIYYAYYHFDNLHFHVTHFYAHLGQPHAMHMTGQRYLFGRGVDRNMDQAMRWFKYASDKGHAHAAHNLAVGHLQGYKTDLKDRDEARDLLRYAADQGVEEAINAVYKLCPNGEC
ncbi:ERAD-associated E3 ubiquitin-protein ligase component HRD3A-like [Asterias rubens]|uniref:ERAD-associated E3 ubiquitin-protein ligase component HRD3A-like n=1 Tax=Asterias rubens TaxID=7604 RepID=UPI0014550286|nr:ERAD-associated E3 ubiquitin-protein ligase component HRD3A-like [Asterias rubens]